MDKCIECDGVPASNKKGVEAMMAEDGTIDPSEWKYTFKMTELLFKVTKCVAVKFAVEVTIRD